MHGTFDGEEFGQAVLEAIKANVDRRCAALEAKITRLEAMLEQRNFSYSGKRANDAAQAEWLLDYEIKLIDNGDGATDLAAAVERLRLQTGGAARRVNREVAPHGGARWQRAAVKG
jgi:hypothetical protein